MQGRGEKKQEGMRRKIGKMGRRRRRGKIRRSGVKTSRGP